MLMLAYVDPFIVTFEREASPRMSLLVVKCQLPSDKLAVWMYSKLVLIFSKFDPVKRLGLSTSVGLVIPLSL